MVLLRADINTGIVLDENYVYATKQKQTVFTIFENADGALESVNDLHSEYLFNKGCRSGVSGNYLLIGRNLSLFGKMNMTSASKPLSGISWFGKAVGEAGNLVGGALLLYEGYLTLNNENGTSLGRFGYHTAGYGTSFYAGLAFGGWAGLIAGGAFGAGELGYDTYKKIVLTLNGQFNNHLQSIINVTMGGG